MINLGGKIMRITNEEFNVGAERIKTDFNVLKPKIEVLFQEATKLGSKIHKLTEEAEQDSQLMFKAVELIDSDDIAELTRLIIALMYVKNPKDKTTLDALNENIEINQEREFGREVKN